MIALKKKVASAGLFAAAAFLISTPLGLSAQTSTLVGAGAAPSFPSHSSGVAPRITKKIDENERTTLTGHVRPFLAGATDRGSVDDSQKVGPIMLMFSRTPKQQADLDAFVDQAHNKNSANFHKWLTPVEFGARFEPADSDVAAVKKWLESKGLKVIDVVPSKTHVAFTGTVGQLREAFHVDIHHVSLNGEEHMANVNDPQVPTALASVIGSLNKLDDFSPKPLVKPFGAFDRDMKTGKVTPSKTGTHGPVASLTGSESGTPFYEIGPQDFYTIYNENPLLSSGITGAGQTIAVIEEVLVNTADVTSFRSVFGLPTYPATPNATAGGVNYMSGSATGLGGYASCLAPVSVTAGHTSGEESEADIDLQWAGAVAPNAIIDFVACGGTAGGDGSTPGAYGTDRSAQYIVNYLSSTVSAASMSYGECEADLTATNMAYYNGQWEQYAAEGITAIVSSGDGGAEQCYQNSTHATSLPPSVNGFGSSAYNVSAGGTDFGDLYETNNYTTSPVTTFWNSTNGTGQSSAVGYVPETTWAGYCSGELYASYLQKAGSTTFGTSYTPSAICSHSTGSLKSYLEVVGGAGGISTYNTIPTWQSVYGVGQNSVSASYRNIPDVSLFASNGWWGHFLPYCESDVYACSVADYTAGDMGAGGTSYVAPQLAGLMALINQKTGSRQGQADYTLYNLAAQEYGTTSSAASSLTTCSGSNVAIGGRPPNSCYFYDISNDMPSLQGGSITPGIYQPCTATYANCYKGTGTTYGVNVVPGTVATSGILGYTASPGYDDATGLGSLNINGLVNGWNNASPAFASTTTISSSAATVVPSGSVTLSSVITATGRGAAAAPAGVVEYFIGSTSGTLLGSSPITSSCTGTGSSVVCTGSASAIIAGTAFTPGTDSVIAYFEGDGANDAPSTSTATSIKAYSSPVGNLDQAIDASTGAKTIPTTDQLFVSGWAADAVDGALSNVKVYVDGVSIGTPTLGVSRPDITAYPTSGYTMYYPASSLSVGSHAVTVIATNSGGVSTTYGPLSITVTAVYNPPIGNLDQAIDATTASTTVSQADQLFVSGWAGDPTDGTPLQTLTVSVDGSVVGSATQGGSRPDVGSAQGPAYANSGFTFYYPGSSLAVGSHTITVTGTDSHGLSTTWGPLSINVTAVQKAPVGNMDQVVDSVTGTQPVSSTGSLFISGWAADYQDNGPAQSVQILIDGNAVGSATLGQSRPDIAAAYPSQNWANSGWTFYYSAAGLSTSTTHTATAIATDSLGLTTTFGPITFSVQ